MRYADGEWYVDMETTAQFTAPDLVYELFPLGPTLSGVIFESEAFTAYYLCSDPPNT